MFNLLNDKYVLTFSNSSSLNLLNTDVYVFNVTVTSLCPINLCKTTAVIPASIHLVPYVCLKQ